MRKLLIVLALTAGLVACGGVDRTGTRDNIVDSYGSQGYTLSPDCVDDVLDEYSDDELKAIDEAFNSQESTAQSIAIQQKLDGCISTSG